MKPSDLPLQFTRGDDARVHVLFRTETGAFDLTDYNLVAEIREKADPALTPVATFTVTRGPAVGEVTLALEEEVTVLLPPRGYWSFRTYIAASDFWQTWLAGSVRVDYTSGHSEANDYTVEVGPDDVTVVVAANIGPAGPAGAEGAPGQQGTSGADGVGVPAGGTTGQGLVKASGADFDTEWSTGAGGGAPTDATYLVASDHASLSADVVVGTAPGGELGGTWASPTVDATHSGSVHLALGSSGSTAAAGDHAHSGTYDPAGSAAAAQAASQPLDSDLTAIAALTTTAFGRALLELANAGAGRTAFGLGTAATSNTGDFDASGAAAAAQAASQPLDSDLTAIAALSTTSYGRAFLALADAAAGRTALGLGTAATSDSGDFQPVDSDLTSIAALSTTSYGRSLLTAADAAGARTTLGIDLAALATDAEVSTAVSTHATNANGHYTTEEFQDAVGGMVAGNTESGGTLTYDDTNGKIDLSVTAQAPPDADYLVGTANAGLTSEIAVGTTPGGELGGTWASPTVDATHSGSAHLALGTTGTTAAAGNDARLSDTRTPTDGSVTDAKVAAANKDGTATTASMRTIGRRPEQAAAGDRAFSAFDWKSLGNMGGLSGVSNAGAAATAQGTPDWTVAIAAGQAILGGNAATIAAGNVTITDASALTAGQSRLDVISASGVNGAKTVNTGTASTTPVEATVGGFDVPIAVVRVSFGDTAVTDSMIYDRRVSLKLYGTGGSNLMPGDGGLTTVGDLMTRDGTSRTRLAKGTDGQMLITDSSTATDLKWTGFPVTLYIPVGDEITNITTGTAKVTFRMPHAMTLTAVRGSLATAQTAGTVLTVDINEAGTSVISTKLTFDNNEKTTTTAATPAVISDSAIADDAEMTVDVDTVGTAGAKGLKIWLIGTRVVP